jgi:hypothetical protein
MTFRGVVRDGVIVILDGEIPDGTPVEVSPLHRRSKKKASTSTKSAKPTRARKPPLEKLPAFGMWKNRPEWKGLSTLEIMAKLREKSLGRDRRG